MRHVVVQYSSVNMKLKSVIPSGGSRRVQVFGGPISTLHHTLMPSMLTAIGHFIVPRAS